MTHWFVHYCNPLSLPFLLYILTPIECYTLATQLVGPPCAFASHHSCISYVIQAPPPSVKKSTLKGWLLLRNDDLGHRCMTMKEWYENLLANIKEVDGSLDNKHRNYIQSMMILLQYDCICPYYALLYSSYSSHWASSVSWQSTTSNTASAVVYSLL